jgi:hypothetical protein
MNFVFPPHRLPFWVLHNGCQKEMVHYTCGRQEEEEAFRSAFLRVTGDKFHLRYYNDDAMEAVVTEFGPQVLRAFRRVRPFAFKADIFRLCALLKHGGFYLDANLRLENSGAFLSAVDPSTDYLLVTDRKGHSLPMSIWQGFLYCRHPNSPLIKFILDKIVANVNQPFDVIMMNATKNYRHIPTLAQHGSATLNLTGPGIFGKAAAEFLDVQDWETPITSPRVQLWKHIYVDGKTTIVNKDKLSIMGKPLHRAKNHYGDVYQEAFSKHGKKNWRKGLEAGIGSLINHSV